MKIIFFFPPLFTWFAFCVPREHIKNFFYASTCKWRKKSSLQWLIIWVKVITLYFFTLLFFSVCFPSVIINAILQKKTEFTHSTKREERWARNRVYTFFFYVVVIFPNCKRSEHASVQIRLPNYTPLHVLLLLMMWGYGGGSACTCAL